jgi:uncharacterized cofD-like protein
MGVKRWLLLLAIGIAAIGLGIGYVLREIYDTWTFPSFVYYLTLQFLPRFVRALLFAVLGLSVIAIAIYRLNRSLLTAVMPPGQQLSVVDVVYRRRQQSRGPKIVVIGGGTGMSVLLRGLKEHTANLAAIVTVADDGGSSGRLRRELGVLPPGDFRNCIAALSEAEPLLTQLFQYRFPQGEGLNGHSFGNLFIAAMAGITGNFERAILESSRVLAVQGRILPSTLEDVTLCADLIDEEPPGTVSRVDGESQITKDSRSIERVYLEPGSVAAYTEAISAIGEADVVIAGPGSLFTSVLPNLLVPGIAQALRSTRALKVYVCNVATQLGETEHFSVEDHVRAIERHIGTGVFDYVLVNCDFDVAFPATWHIELVRPRRELGHGYHFISAEVMDRATPWRHDPQKLAQSLMKLYYSR